MTDQTCPRCGGSRRRRRIAMNDRGNPFRFGPGTSGLPLCSHEFHEEAKPR